MSSSPQDNKDNSSLLHTLDDLRQRGNHEFQQGNLQNAISLYSLAIDQATTQSESSDSLQQEYNDMTITLLCNRSACHYPLEAYEEAKDDAWQAWQLSHQTHVKAAFRLSKTLLALQDYDECVTVLKTALLLESLTSQERTSLRELQTKAELLSKQTPSQPETTIIGVDRTLSIREFSKGKSLGVGNFSEIVVCTHKVTGETFALKLLDKKTAQDLAKRQHPNVYNEIAMERRILSERLPLHRNIVKFYHAMEDYNTLYYLMELHNVNPDLWSQLKYQNTNKMVGCHERQIQLWMWQLINALEHIHSHGLVHRDLKPENILLNKRNQVVVIDFGTAKDLLKQDLNGPEFVGTPDFMSPEAVTGFSGMPGDKRMESDNLLPPATHTADLWALGAMASILYTGDCPFQSPSPYLTFLKIKRCNLTRNHWGIANDDAWDLISKLLVYEPSQRLGADCFEVQNGQVTKSEGYDVLRNHKFFDPIRNEPNLDSITPLPSLQDLCIRACAELAQQDALDLDLCDAHPPGDGSSHDFLRLSVPQRHRILHVLDKLKVFSNHDETRVYRRFVQDDLEFLESKVRPTSRDFVGLTQMNDGEHKPLSARGNADPYATKMTPEPTKIVHLTNPLLLKGSEDWDEDELQKPYRKGWKKCIAAINRARPKLVMVSGWIPLKCRKLLTRLSDTIPVLWNDGTAFYSFWLHGFQGIVLQSKELLKDTYTIESERTSPQMLWIRELLEQCRMSKHQMFAVCDCDPRDLHPLVLKRLARGRTQLLMGLSNDEPFETEISYAANETVGDDNASVKSTDSVEDEQDEWTMKVVGTTENGLRWLTVVEEGDNQWSQRFEGIDCF